MNWEFLRAHLKGARKSWTVWFAAILAAIPEVLPLVQANFSTFAPFIPDAFESKAMQVVALIILLLRMKTTASLAQK